MPQVKGPEDIERIQQLFRRATQDYLSVNIWAQYLGWVECGYAMREGDMCSRCAAEVWAPKPWSARASNAVSGAL